MRKYIINVVCILLICNAYTQYSQKDRQIFNQNLSQVFIGDTGCYAGAYGTQYERIDLYIAQVWKVDSTKYWVMGKTRLKSIICPFEGYIQIQNIVWEKQEYQKTPSWIDMDGNTRNSMSPMKSEVVDIDGYIVGKYVFEEFGNDNYNGVFSGNCKIAFRLDWKHKIAKEGICLAPANQINIKEYNGIWISKNRKITKKCCWADYALPCVPADFYEYNDAAENWVNIKYRYGTWETIYNAYYNDKLSSDSITKERAKCEYKWWK